MKYVDLLVGQIFVFFLISLAPHALSAAVPGGHVTVSRVHPGPVLGTVLG